jgi:hypothetical protein
MLLAIVVIVGLGARVLFDLVGLVRPSWRLDGCYAVLFTIVAVIMLMRSQRDPLAYASLLIAGFWGIRAFVVARR